MTKQELDEAFDIAVKEMAKISLDTIEACIKFERRACSNLVLELASEEDEGEVCTALKNAAKAILERKEE
jgi:hypothetical protein